MKRLLYLAILSMAAMLISAPAASAQDEMTVSIQDFFSLIPISLPLPRGRRSRGLTKDRHRILSLRRTEKSSTPPPYSPVTLTPSPSMKVMLARTTLISA